LERVRPAIDEIDRAVRDLRRPAHVRIVVTMPQSFAAMWFSPRLCLLADAVPGCEIEVLPTQRLCDLKSEGIDFGIRTGPAVTRTNDARPLIKEVLSPVCAPALAMKIEEIGWEAFLAARGVVLNALHPDEWRAWSEAYDLPLPRADRIRTLASFDLVANAVTNGYGVAMGRSPLVDAHLGDGRLVRPFPDKRIDGDWYYLAASHDRPLHDPWKRFRDWIVDQAAL
jgi:LysR family transcriptional regulator of beta-lactamase